jgi:hypothetical protein
MMSGLGNRVAPIALGLSLLTGCKAKEAVRPEAKPAEVAPYIDKGEGVFVITGGGHLKSDTDLRASEPTARFAEHLAQFRKDHPNTEIEKYIPFSEEYPSVDDAVILTRPSSSVAAKDPGSK